MPMPRANTTASVPALAAQPAAEDLEATILRLLQARGPGKTICPSEAARTIAGDDRTRWEPWMEPTREAARRLEARGLLDIVQGGVAVDSLTAKGPIRLRLR